MAKRKANPAAEQGAPKDLHAAEPQPQTIAKAESSKSIVPPEEKIKYVKKQAPDAASDPQEEKKLSFDEDEHEEFYIPQKRKEKLEPLFFTKSRVFLMATTFLITITLVAALLAGFTFGPVSSSSGIAPQSSSSESTSHTVQSSSVDADKHAASSSLAASSHSADNMVTVHIVAGTGGKVAMGGKTQLSFKVTAAPGQSVGSFTATPYSGYTFREWAVIGGNMQNTTRAATSFTVPTNASPGGSITITADFANTGRASSDASSATGNTNAGGGTGSLGNSSTGSSSSSATGNSGNGSTGGPSSNSTGGTQSSGSPSHSTPPTPPSTSTSTPAPETTPSQPEPEPSPQPEPDPDPEPTPEPEPDPEPGP